MRDLYLVISEPHVKMPKLKTRARSVGGYLDMRLVLSIRVVLRWFCKGLGDDILF
jgi:hypothetical protein